MTKFHKSRQFINIGVSNYLLKHLIELENCEIKPSAIQNEYHPLFENSNVLEYCHKNNIQFQGYSPFGQGALFKNENILNICEKWGVKPNHALILYNLINNVAVIPMTKTVERIEDNFNLPSIDDDTLKNLIHDLKSLSIEKNHKFAWNPDTIF